ncbi:pseudouridine synthase [Brevibacterium litoralis]|uniref:pseudouridine synthase n=1 Tax=Brevibacterium litoralis TaxID=3138935 RepID=UPI0032EFE04B
MSHPYRRRSRSPLPPREGISAAKLRAPGGNETHTGAHLPVPASVRDWLTDTVLPQVLHRETTMVTALAETEAALHYFVTDGELTAADGHRVSLDEPVEPGGFYWFHKPIPYEDRIPAEVTVVHEDADLLVVDKPHFLASTPNGVFVRECVVTRLRVARGEDDLVAIHRLDRVTGGLLVLSRNPDTRGKYQVLFQQKRIRKSYRALAWLPVGWVPGDPLPLGLESGRSAEVRTRIRKIDGQRTVIEEPGEPNSHTTVRLDRVLPAAEVPADLTHPGTPGAADHPTRHVGEFVLTPHTGKTHQLRVHMNGLGMPLLGDPVYPVDLGPDPYDMSHVLQLVAERLEFTDPLTGAERVFTSRMRPDVTRA